MPALPPLTPRMLAGDPPHFLYGPAPRIPLAYYPTVHANQPTPGSVQQGGGTSVHVGLSRSEGWDPQHPGASQTPANRCGGGARRALAGPQGAPGGGAWARPCGPARGRAAGFPAFAELPGVPWAPPPARPRLRPGHAPAAPFYGGGRSATWAAVQRPRRLLSRPPRATRAAGPTMASLSPRVHYLAGFSCPVGGLAAGGPRVVPLGAEVFLAAGREMVYVYDREARQLTVSRGGGARAPGAARRGAGLPGWGGGLPWVGVGLPGVGVGAPGSAGAGAPGGAGSDLEPPAPTPPPGAVQVPGAGVAPGGAGPAQDASRPVRPEGHLLLVSGPGPQVGRGPCGGLPWRQQGISVVTLPCAP